jgi:phage-related protein
MGIIDFFTGVFTGDWAMAWEGLKEIFFGVLEALMGFWNISFVGGIKKILFNFLEAGIKRIITFADDFALFFKGGTLKVTEFFKVMGDAIKTRIHDAKEFIAGRVVLIETSFRNLWLGIEKGVKNSVEALKAVWGGVKDWFMRTLINPLIAEFDNISKAFSKGPVEGIKYLINKLIDGFNNALNVFNNLKNNTPFGDKIPNLRIPHLARGGITNGPTLAMVGDNLGGREVISPLDRLQSMLTNSVVQAMQLGGGNRDSGDIILNIDGRTFARIVKPFLQKEDNRVGGDIRIRTI